MRGIAGLVTSALDAGWRAVAPRLRARESSPAREALLAAVNGVLGDHLAATGNPLALPMTLRTGGRDLDPTPAALARAFGTAHGRLVVLVHGLCRNDRHWLRCGHDHGAALARDLGVVPIYVRYNSGLHVSENGRALADLLEALCAAWPAPLEELALVAHSMGGLVARSACHYGRLERQAWVGALRRIVFLGTPHHGAPLERGGHGLETLIGAVPYAAALARLGRLRSAGITDLRHGNLLDEDWRGHDRFAPAPVRRRPVSLPAGVECHALAATQSARGGRLRDRLLGDGLVPVASALGEHADPEFDLRLPESRRFLLRGASHLDLLSSREVYEQLRARLEGQRRPALAQPPRALRIPSAASATSPTGRPFRHPW